MRELPEGMVRPMEVLLQETEDETEAEIVVELRGERIAGWGRARRNPSDPVVPQIGEELAMARALSDLSHKLLEVATAQIERYEGHRISVHP